MFIEGLCACLCAIPVDIDQCRTEIGNFDGFLHYSKTFSEFKKSNFSLNEFINWIYYLVDLTTTGCIFSFFQTFFLWYLNFKIYLYCSHKTSYRTTLKNLKLYSYSFFSCSYSFISLLFSSFFAIKSSSTWRCLSKSWSWNG